MTHNCHNHIKNKVNSKSVSGQNGQTPLVSSLGPMRSDKQPLRARSRPSSFSTWVRTCSQTSWTSEWRRCGFICCFVCRHLFTQNELCFFSPWHVVWPIWCLFFLNHWSLPHKIKSGPKNFLFRMTRFYCFFCVSFPEMTCWRHRFAGCFRMVQEIRSFVSEWEMWFLPLA